MKLGDAKKKLGVHFIPDDVEIDPAVVVGHAFFCKPETHDYRGATIKYLVSNKISFGSNTNILYEMVKKMVSVKCPICGRKTTIEHAGGDSHSECITFECKKCDCEVSLDMPNERGICVRFKKDED